MRDNLIMANPRSMSPPVIYVLLAIAVLSATNLGCEGKDQEELSAIWEDGESSNETDSEGWIVIQRRLDGSVDFYRDWDDYKNGFGNLGGEFWLGLETIHRLTNRTNMLRVELEDTSGNTSYAEYDMFYVSDEESDYQLWVGTYSGTAGDSLSYHNGMKFTTKDQDNDDWGNNCAVKFQGAWWYKNCHRSNLNGLYLNGTHSSFADGVNWKTWKGQYYSAMRAEMKIKLVD